jgi:hypothetical protein
VLREFLPRHRKKTFIAHLKDKNIMAFGNGAREQEKYQK